MSRIRFTHSAETDLLELWVTIAEENFTAADETLDAIQATVTLLGTQPEMGRARPELAEGLRSLPTTTPYLIFYLPDDDGLLVVRVLHHARDIDAEYFS
ncbi:MAG: type II toxin-antitoxin system RelE/ParE family toxin [Gammaproteobacteria bacterium]|nr:type II toxin-antitoxin system RelE/ParE family toxin [Gammaproteobacteria bacterium]MBU1776556.1 type II toxin-antitoxin system RelE/ParE family toxin [Gammaproteobacteria bacterium]MBU1969435.1 type II toxin-antitoxin system RelE/ParE family toxin [Gammaproteobacteria bacterium]